ncbi:hypothetical protein CP8484711_0126B, partial [Chlamydia psittaci 84-8471/1]
GQGFTRG